MKNDPKLIAAARELRDRWLERVNTTAGTLHRECKYAVGRAVNAEPLLAAATLEIISLPLLPAPAAA